MDKNNEEDIECDEGDHNETMKADLLENEVTDIMINATNSQYKINDNSKETFAEDHQIHFKLKEIGDELHRREIGVLICIENKDYLYYHSAPADYKLVILNESTIIRNDRVLLKSLCELLELQKRNHQQWNCESKGFCSLRATCKRSGIPRKSKSVGIRNKISQKVNCPACVTTVPLTNGVYKLVLNSLENKGFTFEQKPESLNVICRVNKVNVNHEFHAIEKALQNRKYISSVKDLINEVDIREALLRFLSYTSKQKGSNIKAWIYLQELFPNYHFTYDVIRNSVHTLEKNDEDAMELIKFMKVLHENGDLEYFSYGLTKTKVLDYVTFAFKGCLIYTSPSPRDA